MSLDDNNQGAPNGATLAEAVQEEVTAFEDSTRLAVKQAKECDIAGVAHSLTHFSVTLTRLHDVEGWDTSPIGWDKYHEQFHQAVDDVVEALEKCVKGD